MTNLPPYDPDANCPKCGHDDLYTHYYEMLDDYIWGRRDHHSDPFPHLSHHCKCCGYSWLTAPLDATPAEIPMPRPTIVCLCGSTRFSEAFREANLRETLLGKIVLTIGCDIKSDDALGLSDDTKTFLDNLHFHKINLADEILVLNVGGYIGESTQNEITYAREQGKRIRWLETPDDPDEAAFRAGELLSRSEEHVPPDAQKPASAARQADEQPESQDRQLARLQRTMMVDHEPSIPVSRIVAVLAERYMSMHDGAQIRMGVDRANYHIRSLEDAWVSAAFGVDHEFDAAIRAELARRKGAA